MTPTTSAPNTLSAHERPIHTVFSNSFIFTIPDYQRSYSWTTEQTEDLLDDLLVAMGEGGFPLMA